MREVSSIQKGGPGMLQSPLKPQFTRFPTIKNLPSAVW